MKTNKLHLEYQTTLSPDLYIFWGEELSRVSHSFIKLSTSVAMIVVLFLSFQKTQGNFKIETIVYVKKLLVDVLRGSGFF